MISVEHFHIQILQSLVKYGLEPSPNNVLRVINLSGIRWDLTPDQLVKACFSVKESPKNVLKIETIRPCRGRRKAMVLIIISLKIRKKIYIWLPSFCYFFCRLD